MSLSSKVEPPEPCLAAGLIDLVSDNSVEPLDISGTSGLQVDLNGTYLGA